MKSLMFSMRALIFVSLLSLSAVALALTSKSRVILDEAVQTQTGESESRVALDKLKSKPRADVIAALREGLRSGPPWESISARAATALDARELVPDLLARAKASEDWRVLSSLEILARGGSHQKEVETLLTKKLQTSSSPSKVVALESLAESRAVVSAALFDSLVKDESYEVRESTVRHFALTRTLYSKDEQVRRFKTALALSPYQVRLEALHAFEDVPVNERPALKAVVNPALCASEKNEEVKVVCSRVMRTGQAGSK